MTEQKPPTRIERTDDGRLRIVYRCKRDIIGAIVDLTRPDHVNDLEGEHEDMFVDSVRGEERVRVGTAAHARDAEGWRLRGENAIVYETPIVERDLNDAEQAFCEDNLAAMYRNVESVVEFTIPEPQQLRGAILSGDVDRFDGLTATIDDAEHRDHVVTELQDAIETNRLRQAKLSHNGHAADLEPEWDPENDHNDDRSTSHVRSMAGMRADSHLLDFRTVLGLDYHALKQSRLRVLGLPEPRHADSWWAPPAFDLCDHDDWSYCQFCGGVAPEDRFLHVLRRVAEEGIGSEQFDDDPYADEEPRRVCEDCAERNSGEHETFSEAAVARAQDERAQRLGGNRRVQGEYGGGGGA